MDADMVTEDNNIAEIDAQEVDLEISIDEQFAQIFDDLLVLDYSHSFELLELEKRLYVLLRNNPEHLVGLVILMQVQIMLGNRAKAKAIAYKIWEKGGTMIPAAEFMYISNLINIGLLEMASVLLKPKFEHLQDKINFYYPSMLKFSIMTGNLNLLEKIVANVDDNIDVRHLSDLIICYKELKYADHFKNIQRMVIEEAKELICSYETLFFVDRNFTDVEILLYTAGDAYERYGLKQKIDNKINAYFINSNEKKLNNIVISVHDIKEHWSLASEERQE